MQTLFYGYFYIFYTHNLKIILFPVASLHTHTSYTNNTTFNAFSSHGYRLKSHSGYANRNIYSKSSNQNNGLSNKNWIFAYFDA